MTAGLVAWLTGRPAAGKSTIARLVIDRLRRRGLCAVLLDGDEVRSCLHPPAGYDDEGRARFYATIRARRRMPSEMRSSGPRRQRREPEA